MTNAVQQFVEEYTAALHEYLSRRDEAALQHVYELGRRALSEGAGVLEMIDRHFKALASILLHQRTAQETASAVMASAELLSESLSPFEMTYHGFQNSIHLLTQLSETLEQRVAERTAELQQMKERYAGIFENAIEGIFLSTPEGRFLAVNPAMAHKFGYQSPQELMASVTDIGRTLYVDPDRRNELIRLMEAQGYVWEFESQVYGKTGTIIWISENARIVRDAHGNRYYQGFVIDITDRKRAEQALLVRARQQAVVAEFGQRALAGNDLTTLMHEAAEYVAQTLGVEFSKLLELLPDRTAFLLRAGVGWRDGLIGQAMVSAGTDSQAGYTLHSGGPVIVNDLPTETRFRGPTLLHEHGVISGMSVIIQTQERPFGVLSAHTATARTFTQDDVNFLQSVANVLAMAMQRKQAEQQLRESREQLHSLSSHLLSVREEERSAIAREIHDEFAQALTGLKMDLSWLAARLPPNQPALFEKARTMATLIDSTVQSVRKIVGKLRPGLLDDLGLVAALEWYAHDFQTRTGMQCKFTSCVPDLHLDRERATAVFRIFQESLTNVARHANASRVTAKLNVVSGDLILEIKDNGRGITDGELANPKSFGLLGMRERAYLLGGEIRILGRPGKGTAITVQIPIEGSQRI
jgi:PAS domain S-box-containing protein